MGFTDTGCQQSGDFGSSSLSKGTVTMKILIVCICVAMLCVAGIASCNKPEDTPDPATGSGGQESGGGATTPAPSGGTDAAVAAAAKQAEAAKAEAAKAEAAKQAEAAKAAASKQAEAAKEWAASALRDPSKANQTAPATFKAKFETSKGDFVIEVSRDWSPNGADRFYNLVKAGFYDDVRFFRVVSGFMAQLGMNGDPSIHSNWTRANIMDDPAKKSNTRGHVTFAKTGAPNSRSTQIFINFKDNSFLDRQGFSPFGVVMGDGMKVVDSLYAGYGDGPPGGRGPSQDLIRSQGNAYLTEKFPELDYVKRATIIE